MTLTLLQQLVVTEKMNVVAVQNVGLHFLLLFVFKNVEYKNKTTLVVSIWLNFFYCLIPNIKYKDLVISLTK